MALTTFRFFIFAIILIIVYFIVPKKGQWIVLLVASIAFYALAGLENSFFIVITALTTFFSAWWIEKETLNCSKFLKDNKELLPKEERKIHKTKSVNKRKLVLAACLVINFGILCVFKYTNFAISIINSISTGSHIDAITILVPLGISFYTFTSMGYLLDVYWEKTPAQKNFFKLLLFTCFFPQITQGPISDYRALSPSLYASHKFEYDRFAWGVQRFIWGLVKKLAIADVASVYVTDLFANFQNYSGITVYIGMLCYTLQIYADFSGYMDMMCGLCQILGIDLPENFERPYFSKSISEYWRRWHITLGAWFKNYVYYPAGFSRWAQFVGKKGKKIFGNTFAKAMPGTIALIIVWFTTGLWHGANWGYIVWGLLNGVFIIATLWLEPFYALCRKAFHIKESAWWWRTFQVLRTFFMITFIKILPEVGGLSAGLALWAQVFTSKVTVNSFNELLPFVDDTLNLAVMIILTILLFIVSLIQRKEQVRVRFNKLPMPLRVFILALLFIVAIEFGARSVGLNAVFLYENF